MDDSGVDLSDISEVACTYRNPQVNLWKRGVYWKEQRNNEFCYANVEVSQKCLQTSTNRFCEESTYSDQNTKIFQAYQEASWAAEGLIHVIPEEARSPTHIRLEATPDELPPSPAKHVPQHSSLALDMRCHESPSALYTPTTCGTTSETSRRLLLEHDNDHLGLQPYYTDIYLYKREVEMKFHPAGSLKAQPQITEGLRGMLVDAMIRVSHRLELQLETTFLAVSILDRFLLTMTISRDYLPLLGVTALLIASKQEEVNPPEISTLISASHLKLFSLAHVRHLERLVLARIKFDLLVPTSLYFLEHYASLRVSMAGVATYSTAQAIKTKVLGRYLLEMTLANYRVYQFPPSVLGMTALETADRILGHTTRIGSVTIAGHSRSLILNCQEEMQTVKDFVCSNWTSEDLNCIFERYNDLSRSKMAGCR